MPLKYKPIIPKRTIIERLNYILKKYLTIRTQEM